MLRMKIHYDMWRKGGRLTFKLIRPQGNPPINSLMLEETFNLHAVRLRRKGLPSFRLDIWDKFNPQQSLFIEGCEFHCRVIDSVSNIVEIMAPIEPQCEHLQVSLRLKEAHF